MKTIVLALLLAAPAFADPSQPIQKLGTCPLGYYGSSGYCLPTTSRQAIPKTSSPCPLGWVTSGNYCAKR